MRITQLKSVLFLVLIFQFRQCVESAKILGVFPLAGKSLNILYNRLMKGLADVGHDVMVISAHKNKFPITNGSYTDVLLTGFIEEYELLFETTDFFATPEQYPIWESLTMHSFIIGFCNKTFQHPNVINFLKAGHQFDLVITEHAWSDSMLAFGAIYNCPLVVFSSMGGVNPWVNEMIGNPMPISYVPHYWMLGDFSKGMNIIDRLHNLLYYLYDPIHNYFIAFPAHNELLKSAIRHPPNVEDVYYNASLILLGSHSSLRQAVPLTPNIIEIGGFHIDPPKKLPKDLQDFMDGAENGVIFFSMGSHLKSKSFSPERKRLFLNVFRKLKMKILWKFEDEILPGKPENVLIRKWLPQVVAHPNIKLFISHGGYGSTLETIYHGVPTLMLPVFADQFNNANQAERLGYALKLSFGDKHFTEEKLLGMIEEMINNPKYTRVTKHLSHLFHDRPMKPLDTAIYWIEYVIRHRGADHLKVAGVKLPWYQYYMADVFLVLVFIFSLVTYVFIRIFKRVFNKMNTPSKVKEN